ncbi:MAG: hypothetical protein A2010_04600 [Nitrospirae bacterium GWD2_57_9]|nr:MAG: hypothetical protein A2010_04600 [Nitrospirae bacterium GWD2_57_9]
MNKSALIFMLLVAMVLVVPGNASAVPPVLGTPTIDSPQLLDWGQDVNNGEPDLTEQTANRLVDLHGSFSDCDIALSTAGNYHMALRDLWYDIYLPQYASELGLKNWFFTTSPPVALKQLKNGAVVFGNMSLRCMPQLAVGPQKVINDLKAAGLTEGQQIPIFRNRGNVLLVKKGNPKHILTIWDLGRPNVVISTPNQNYEKNTFDNYSGSIYNIAMNDAAHAPDGWDAGRLFNSIFGPDKIKENGTNHPKWVAGEKIHHREVPWSIAYGRADVAVIFYHLALDAVRRFPDTFEIVSLGGTIDNPQPLPGNQVGAHFAVRINGTWSDKQVQARERLIDAFNSAEFTSILEKHGLQR